MRTTLLRPEHVEFMPETLQQGVLYISERFQLAIHLCCCGCGNKAVTPLGAADWQLTTDGEAVTLAPSLLMTTLCNSHYFIRRNQVDWL